MLRLIILFLNKIRAELSGSIGSVQRLQSSAQGTYISTVSSPRLLCFPAWLIRPLSTWHPGRHMLLSRHRHDHFRISQACPYISAGLQNVLSICKVRWQRTFWKQGLRRWRCADPHYSHSFPYREAFKRTGQGHDSQLQGLLGQPIYRWILQGSAFNIKAIFTAVKHLHGLKRRIPPSASKAFPSTKCICLELVLGLIWSYSF